MNYKCLLVALPALVLAACAPIPRTEQGLNFEYPADYLAWQSEIESELADGNPRELDEEEWQKFRDLRAQSHEILGEHESMAALSEDERMAIFNLHEELTALVVEDEGPPPVVCRWEHRVGSHLRQRVCTQRAPAGSADAQRTYLEETMRRIDRSVNDLPPGG